MTIRVAFLRAVNLGKRTVKMATLVEVVARLGYLTNEFDTLVVKGRDVHWRMRGKSTDTKLKPTDWERIVGRKQSTSRNMTMLRKLAAKVNAHASRSSR